MKYLLFCLLFLSFSLQAQEEKAEFNSDKIIEIIRPDYFSSVEKKEYVKLFLETPPVQISGVKVVPMFKDGHYALVAAHYECEEFSYGHLTEFYLLDISKNPVEVIAKPPLEEAHMYYGGGTQRYSEPLIMPIEYPLGEDLFGFIVIQPSYHFASQTSEETLTLFLIKKDQIFSSLESSIFHGYMNFSLAEEIDNPDFMIEIKEDLEELLPKDYTWDEIIESTHTFEILDSKTEGVHDILMKETIYTLEKDGIKESIDAQFYFWNGNDYQKL